MLLHKLKFNTSEPFIARTAARAVVGTLNALIIGLISSHLRTQRFGMPVQDPTLDLHTETVTEIDGQEHEANERAEQGVALPREPVLVTATKLLVIRNYLADDLEKNAGEREMPLTNTRIKDPWHVAQPIGETLSFMMSNTQTVDATMVKEQAKALDITEAEVREALAARPARQQQFMHQNKEEILSIAKSLIATHIGQDGHELEVEAVFDLLAPITKLQLIASADRALFKARQREIQAHVSGNLLAMSNIGVIDGVRRQLRAEVQDWLANQTFKNDLDEATSRGARVPNFAPAPTAVKPTEAEQSLSRRNGTHN